MELKPENLTVGHFMTAYPITVQPNVDFKTVVKFMAEHKIGHLIVNDDNKIRGVLSEHNILKYLAENEDFSKTTVSDLGFHSFTKINPDMTIPNAAKLMIVKKTSPLVFADEKLVGIITSTDMLQAFRLTKGGISLDDVIRYQLCKCSWKDTIISAIKEMAEKKVGSLIVYDITEYGIFTERDLLNKVLLKEISLNDQLGNYCSDPLVVTNKGVTAFAASNIMAENNIKRLGIVENEKLVGIVTARDLIDAYQRAFFKLKPYEEQLSDYVSG